MVWKVFHRVIVVLAAMAACGLIFSFLASRLPLADSVAHFRFHLSVALALAAVMLLIARDMWSAGFVCAVSLAGLISLVPAFPPWGAAGPVGQTPSITVVQFNLSFRNRTPDAVADLIRGEGADIVTLQEVTGTTGRVIELLDKQYPYRVRCPFARVGGVAVLSRFPKAPGRSEGCVEGKGLAWLRVMVDGRAVSVASLHLFWPYPFGQARQIGELEEPLENIPRPVLVAGDFNAAPWSHAVGRVADATGTRVASGLRFTFDFRPIRWAPALAMPIDHVLLPDGFALLAVRSTPGPGPGSDHAAVVARLALPPEAEPEGLSPSP